MLRSFSRKRDSALYTTESSIPASQNHGCAPHRQDSRPAALQVDADGAVLLHQDPADAISRTHQLPSGRMLRQQRTVGRETMVTSRRVSTLHGADSICATHGPDVNAKTLKQFGTLKNKKVVYSPLQGTQSISAADTSCNLPAVARGLSTTDRIQSKQPPESLVISEMENLAIDTHQQWLDAFIFTPIPALIVGRLRPSVDIGHEVVEANAAAVMVFGRDAAALKAQNLEVLVEQTDTTGPPPFSHGTETGLSFRMDQCSIKTLHEVFKASLVLIPVSDVCTVGQPSCYLVLIVDEKDAAPAISSYLPGIPSIQEIACGIGSRQARKGMYTSMLTGQAKQSDSVADAGAYHQEEALRTAHSEAAQRRMDGKCPKCQMPSPYNVIAWIEKFESLLTIAADK